MTVPIVTLTETMVTPAGLDPDQNPDAARHFAVKVVWQAHLGWTVTTADGHTRLSVKGRKWTARVEKRNRRFYYFPDYNTALQAAIEAVDSIPVNGRTWSEWENWKKEQA